MEEIIVENPMDILDIENKEIVYSRIMHFI